MSGLCHVSAHAHISASECHCLRHVRVVMSGLCLVMSVQGAGLEGSLICFVWVHG
jgi:hypothetical protein